MHKGRNWNRELIDGMRWDLDRSWPRFLDLVADVFSQQNEAVGKCFDDAVEILEAINRKISVYLSSMQAANDSQSPLPAWRVPSRERL
jgi:hypothetical protein